ncbi:hypothetical protein, partial [Microbacterium sp. Bi128]|uniref:hypothetical protein n=1 Tax=Microbacterium sp. Bi128 TaxID=2821115 RepID=UPI001E3D16F7
GHTVHDLPATRHEPSDPKTGLRKNRKTENRKPENQERGHGEELRNPGGIGGLRAQHVDLVVCSVASAAGGPL